MVYNCSPHIDRMNSSIGRRVLGSSSEIPVGKLVFGSVDPFVVCLSRWKKMFPHSEHSGVVISFERL